MNIIASLGLATGALEHSIGKKSIIHMSLIEPDDVVSKGSPQCHVHYIGTRQAI